MLSLKKRMVQEYWQKTDKRMAKILSVMENVEHWVVDDISSCKDKISDFGQKLETAKRDVLSNNAEKLIHLMGYMSSSKSIRVMNWLDEMHPGLSVHFTMEAKRLSPSLKTAALMMDRLSTIKSLSLIGKVFAPNRAKLINELLKEDNSKRR